ncbi:heme exporter protein CcmB [Fulvivirga sedimenti]|uniref:Heme exporter protein CcmB n=1 Tax=Fulvivirga sedimenti TaxID=2879465 RepID=A0A9X1KZH3_9BACT|nr:heme exporter protein CcmB [Fulvivirga sedimenti]MCA6078260.1 heme exporter protein CcmB [Fulvivirga sedimenti]
MTAQKNRGQQILKLIAKEWQVEWRQRYALNGLLLYLVSTIFICYLSFNVKVNQLNPLTWNALFWIILLFSAVNAVAKSFMQEHQGRLLYYYSLFSPQVLILARLIYNTALMLGLSIVGFLMYALVLGNPVGDMAYFFLSVVLGSMGFSVTFTMISAIAAKAGNNQTLMAILGFPIVLPMLLMVIKLSKNALDGLERSASTDELLTLIAINVLVGAVSFLLFPYLWRT